MAPPPSSQVPKGDLLEPSGLPACKSSLVPQHPTCAGWLAFRTWAVGSGTALSHPSPDTYPSGQ